MGVGIRAGRGPGSSPAMHGSLMATQHGAAWRHSCKHFPLPTYSIATMGPPCKSMEILVLLLVLRSCSSSRMQTLSIFSPLYRPPSLPAALPALLRAEVLWLISIGLIVLWPLPLSNPTWAIPSRCKSLTRRISVSMARSTQGQSKPQKAGFTPSP